MMNLRFNINSVSSCLPLCHTKLFDEVINERSHGEVEAVWLTAGHLFVSLEGGTRLVAFDAKCADYIQPSDNAGCLDLSFTSPVVTVLSQSANKILLVHKNGQVQMYSYRNDTNWKLTCTFNICTVATATVTTVCLNVAHNTLYFCQREGGDTETQSVCTVFRRHLKEDEEGNKTTKAGPATAVITNCPDCSVYPMGHGIILTTNAGGSSQVSLCVIVCTLTSRIDVVAGGGDTMTITDLSLFSAVEFRQIVLKCLKLCLKKSATLISSHFVHKSQTLLQLYEDGTLTSVTMPTEDNNPVKSVILPQFSREPPVTMVIVSGCVGVVYQTEIRMYSLSRGDLVCTLGLPEDTGRILGSCHPILGGHQSGVFSGQDIYLIQKSSPSQQPDRFLLDCQTFQTDAVKLSYVNKLHRYTSATLGTLSLDTLREAWLKGLSLPPTTKLVETVEPFLSEFWKLENQLREGLTQPKARPAVCQRDVSHEVRALLDPRSPMSRSVRQSQLVYLSHWFPDDLLDTLLVQLQYQDEGSELSTSSQQLWQSVLAQEQSELPGNSDLAVPLFELMCHLLYKYQPHKMLKFLQRAQKAWDHKVGMSAFVRHRQSCTGTAPQTVHNKGINKGSEILMVYERALRCLPEPENSQDKLTAIQVHTHILLTSEVDGCYMKAVRLLLQYQCWEECIELLARYRDRCKQYVLLYQMVLASITKNHKLHVYADRIFPLMPQFNSCDNITKGDDCDPPVEIFARGEDSVSIGSVRPYLLKCLGYKSQDDSASHS